MHGAGDLELEDLGLETTLHELSHGQTEDVIELTLVLSEETETSHTAEKGFTLEDTTLILLIESKKGTGSSTDLGQEKLDTPHLTLVLETELPNNLHLGFKTLLFEGTLGLLEGGGIVTV
jgi:hypothetical protein